mgnify:FL=1|tara:strand:- start:28 stop:489 length:462 start_codon:yes stop_codon:yes gene_type:complete
MYRQSLLESLQSIFPNLSWLGMQNLTPGGIAGGFAEEYGIEPGDLPKSLFTSLSPSLFKSAQYKGYSPMMESEGTSLLTNLQSSLGGADVRASYGGFAGTSESKKKTKQVKDVYGKGMGETFANIRGMQSEALQGIQSEVDRWHESAQAIKGY